MSLYLNELELLKVAQKIEEEGLRFYTQAMENAKSEEIKSMFNMLAQEERIHASLFAKIYSDLKEESIIEDDYIFDEETSGYLKAIADNAVFNVNGLNNAKIADIKDSLEAVLVGIQAEKDAILFYTKLKEVAKLEKTKTSLETLINEEGEHLAYLNKVHKSLTL